MVKKVRWVREITLVAKATDVRDMGLHRHRIEVGSHQHPEARFLKAETQTARTTEQI